MKIKSYGHSCFLITADNGTRILTDPYDPSTGRELSDIACDAVTCSHDHFDHCYVKAASGSPAVINDNAEHDIQGVKIRAVDSFHDECGGAKRGPNIIYCYEIDGIHLVHFGDLGADLTEEQCKKIGKADVIMLPVGGKFTIDAAQAMELVNKVDPHVIIPMHYQADFLSFEIGSLDAFLALANNIKIVRTEGKEYLVSAESLPKDKEVIVF